MGVLDDLALALEQTDAQSNIARIRECPICLEMFWAGRGDREACLKHAARWRKIQQRDREKKAKEKRAKNRARRQKSKAEKPITFSVTTATICDAVFARYQTTEKILDYCWLQLSKQARGTLAGTYSGATIHRGIQSLVQAGYITPGEEQEEATNPFYVATEKLKRLRRELRDEKYGGYYSFRRLIKEKEPPATL